MLVNYFHHCLLEYFEAEYQNNWKKIRNFFEIDLSYFKENPRGTY